MEVIELAGYTEDEKLQIAKRYLVPRQIERNGLRKKSWISFGDKALRTIIHEYTREAGVRHLEREIGNVCRKVARDIAERRRERAAGPDGRSTSSGCASCSAGRKFYSEAQAPHAGARRGHRPGLDSRRRRRAVHRGHGDARAAATC